MFAGIHQQFGGVFSGQTIHKFNSLATMNSTMLEGKVVGILI